MIQMQVTLMLSASLLDVKKDNNKGERETVGINLKTLYWENKKC